MKKMLKAVLSVVFVYPAYRIFIWSPGVGTSIAAGYTAHKVLVLFNEKGVGLPPTFSKIFTIGMTILFGVFAWSFAEIIVLLGAVAIASDVVYFFTRFFERL